MDKIRLKAPGNYSASVWYNNCSICLWENAKTLISMISGFWDVSLGNKTNYFLFVFGDTRTPKQIKNKPGACLET